MALIDLFLCGFLQQDIKPDKEISTKTYSDDILRKSHSLLLPLRIYCSCEISKDTKFALTKNFLYYTYENTLKRHNLQNSLTRKEGKEDKYCDAEIVNTSKTGNQYIKSLHAGNDFVTIVLDGKDGGEAITLVLSDDGSCSTIETGENEINEFILGKSFGLLLTSGSKLFQIELKSMKASCIDMKPLQLPTSSVIKAISCGKEHALILTDDHKVLTVGGGSRGQLGNGSADYKSDLTLVEPLELLNIDDISAGGWHSLVLSNGDLYGWGWNESGQIGSTSSVSDTEEKVMSEKNISKLLFLPSLVDTPIDETYVCVSAGSRHSAAVTSQGVLYTWGWNGYGQLCHGDQDIRISPCHVKCFEKRKVIGAQCSDWATLVIIAT